MNWIEIFRSGISTGTVLLIAAIGEILTERAGIQNLGVEGMMLVGAMAGFKVAFTTGNVWLGLLAAIAAGGLLSLAHALVTIHFQADQTVSGLSLTFLGTGLALVLGDGLTGQTGPVIPRASIPLLSQIPYLGQIAFADHNLLVYFGYLLLPLSRISSTKLVRVSICVRWGRTRLPLTRWVSISTAPATFYTFIGGCFAGLAGAAISVAIAPGWYSNLTVNGQGWIAVALVIFAHWNPWRAALGGYLFGILRRFTLDLQGPRILFGLANPFFYNTNLVFFLQMTPYILTIIALIWGSSAARKKRIGAPAALGTPYQRGERGL